MVLAGKVKGRIPSFFVVTPTDTTCGKLFPGGPESTSNVASMLLCPVDKERIEAVDPGRPVGSSVDGSTFASWAAGLSRVLREEVAAARLPGFLRLPVWEISAAGISVRLVDSLCPEALLYVGGVGGNWATLLTKKIQIWARERERCHNHRKFPKVKI